MYSFFHLSIYLYYLGSSLSYTDSTATSRRYISTYLQIYLYYRSFYLTIYLSRIKSEFYSKYSYLLRSPWAASIEDEREVLDTMKETAKLLAADRALEVSKGDWQRWQP